MKSQFFLTDRLQFRE